MFINKIHVLFILVLALIALTITNINIIQKEYKLHNIYGAPAGSRINLPLKNGEDVRLDEDYIKQLNKTYPLINIESELQKMRTWLMSNPNKQKTARGTPRFVSSWLSKIGNSNVKTEMSYADIHKAVLEAKNVRK